MIAALISLWAKVKLNALLIGGAIAAAVFGYWRIREDGKSAARVEQMQAREELQEKYDEVDRQNIDPAGSYDRLRGLSKRDR